jgi:hypothetical protein
MRRRSAFAIGIIVATLIVTTAVPAHAASGPPRSRSAARRRCGSLGSPRTRRSCRLARSREHQDVEKFGAGSGTDGVEAFSDSSL